MTTQNQVQRKSFNFLVFFKVFFIYNLSNPSKKLYFRLMYWSEIKWIDVSSEWSL